ncbi:SRPBCC family protein [Streptomyces sp. NPDC059063]|uniref:SRPBCC family protein n=1 Tax=unclassified Streptomyces TaxID=2593676 RepID=UPI0036A13151
MRRRLRPVGLDFLTAAPLRHVFAREVAAPPEDVYRALAVDVEQWPAWFPSVTRARPTRGGEGREIRLQGGIRFEETILAAEAPERYVYRVDASNVPGLRALVEEWHLTPTATGTRVRWTFAVRAMGVPYLVVKFGRKGFDRSFQDAVAHLERRLTKDTP